MSQGILFYYLFCCIFPLSAFSFSPSRLRHPRSMNDSCEKWVECCPSYHSSNFSGTRQRQQRAVVTPLHLHENQDRHRRHELYWLDEFVVDDDDDPVTLGQSIADGEVVVCLPHVATEEECEDLFTAARRAVALREEPPARGRSRMSVSDPTSFGGTNVVMKCEEILLRVLDYLDDHEPSIYDTLFWPRSETWCEWQPLNALGEEHTVPPLPELADECTNLRELYVARALEWSEGEPAINVYEGGGYFGAHKDHLALTVLIPLTTPQADFEGGGTGFWAGNRDTSENPEGREPDLILKPPAGSALVFGGDVTHAGMPVASGLRSVFVCSFSTRTPASSPDRLHGMTAPPVTSAGFKGSL